MPEAVVAVGLKKLFDGIVEVGASAAAADADCSPLPPALPPTSLARSRDSASPPRRCDIDAESRRERERESSVLEGERNRNRGAKKKGGIIQSLNE